MHQLQGHLQEILGPGYGVPADQVGGAPSRMQPFVDKMAGRGVAIPFQAPVARCTKAIEDLGLVTHPVRDTLRATVETMVELGLVVPGSKSKDKSKGSAKL